MYKRSYDCFPKDDLHVNLEKIYVIHNTNHVPGHLGGTDCDWNVQQCLAVNSKLLVEGGINGGAVGHHQFCPILKGGLSTIVLFQCTRDHTATNIPLFDQNSQCDLMSCNKHI